MNHLAPVNAGHHYANLAEDFEEQEKWLMAAEAHSDAAAKFETALNDTTDEEATKTLRLLTSNHKRKANELTRKSQRVINAAANQRMRQMVGNTPMPPNGLRHALPDNRHSMTGNLLVSRLARGEYGEGSHHRTSEIGESYALLSNEDHDDDPFNKFLEAVEGLVQQLFNPAVAFTSAPLNENDIPVPILTTPTEEKMLEEETPNNLDGTGMMDSYYLVPSPDGSDDVENFRNLVNKTESISIKNKQEKSLRQQQQEDIKLENEKLRAQVAQLNRRVKSLQMTAEEGNMLKSSVLQFRNDVHIQAKRIMQSHHESSMRSSAAALLGPGSTTISSSIRHPTLAGSGHDLASRLRELEAENIKLRTDHENQKVSINKYCERWEMLKENAKKRRASAPIAEETEN
ncbi:hypothetical protein HPULCUR_011773 [Helicostylum pulchrum]|uniref:Uncharacterized protein n=1 Tax=Helicostylum pulchrum TaxID=562976 RepID=A0ABP9YI06_9FUNG